MTSMSASPGTPQDQDLIFAHRAVDRAEETLGQVLQATRMSRRARALVAQALRETGAAGEHVARAGALGRAASVTAPDGEPADAPGPDGGGAR